MNKNQIKRNIPNILTLSRIVLALSLIFIHPPLGLLSFIIYCIAGFTDMADGFLARRISNGESRLGAELDSVADLTLALVGIFVILPVMEIWSWFWMVAIGFFVVKVLSASISGLIKHRRPLFLATIANKIAALLLFLCPILYFIIGAHLIISIYLVFLVVWFTLAITEEAIINLMLDKPSKSIKGIWKVGEENRKSRSAENSIG